MRNVGFDAVSKTIGDLYEAAYDHAAWSKAIGSLCDLFQGSHACFAKLGDVNNSSNVATSHDLDQLYYDRFFKSNPLLDALTTASIGDVYFDHAAIGHQRLRSSDFWNEWMKPQDMFGGLQCKLLASGRSTWLLNVQRGSRQPMFDQADAELLQTLTPHLLRIGRMNQLFGVQQSLASAFSHLPFGVVVVDGHQRVLCMNDAAEALTTHPSQTMLVRSGQLIASDRDEAGLLGKLIADACSSGIPGVKGDMMVRGRGPDAKQGDLWISVGPLTNTYVFGMPYEARAAVFIRKVSLGLPQGFEDQARKLFGFTPAESRLATSLATGRSLKDAATAQGLQFGTARAYLLRIFRKTGTKRQSDLIVFLRETQTV